jgi:FMN-dependent NADH-azoreductase
MTNKTILHVNSSGRYQGSISREISELVVGQLSQQHLEHKIIERDVAKGLPFIDAAWINANFTPDENRSEEDKIALAQSDALVEEIMQADHIVIAAPIYNFGIPAALKAWIDLIARARLTFKYTENGPVGLVTNTKATLVMASGGVPIESEMDLATKYLKQALSFIGITDVTVVDCANVNIEEPNKMLENV